MERLVVPSLLVFGTHGSGSSGGISSFRLQSTATSKRSLPVQLRGNEGGEAFLSVPLVLDWTTESAVGSTLPIRLCNIASVSYDDNTISLKFKGIGTGSSMFTIKLRLESERVATSFANGLEYLIEWNRIHEKGLLEYHKIDALSVRPSNSNTDVIRLGLKAAKLGDDAAFMQALCQGYPIDAVGGSDKTGDTALLLACRHGHRGIVALCLSRKALLDPLDSSRTAIHAAVKGGNVELVRYLLDHAESRDGQPYVEALLNCMDESSMTPLHRAVAAGNLSMARLCIERGASVSAVVDRTGETAVHVAAKAGDPMVLSVLLEAADPSLISFPDLLGLTPLMTAVAASRHASNDSSFRRGNIRCVLDLLHAASLADESFDGSGALQIARDNGMSGIASIIKDRMQHLKAVKEQADVLSLTGLARNQYRAEQCLQLQKLGNQGNSTLYDYFTENAGGFCEGAPTPLPLPPPPSSSYSSSSSVGPPVVSDGKSAALQTGNLSVETKERATIKDLPAAKLSSNVTTKMVDGDNVVAPGPSDTDAADLASGDAGSSAAVDTGDPLKDDPIYAKYFKMVRMGVPPFAVQHEMVKEKIDPAILDLDPEKSLNSQRHLLKKSEEQPKKKPPEPKVITGQKTAVTTTPLHWDALQESVVSHPESLWKSDTNPLVGPEALKMIEENFEAKGKSAVVVLQAVPAEKGQMILGTKWANNTSITMKPFSMAGVANMYDLVHLVSSLSSDPVVTLERAESLLILLQTIDRTELEAIRKFSGDPADLCRPDRFIHITMKEENRFLQKLEMFCFVQRFDVVINDLRELANKMLAACNEICGNQTIGRLLCSLLRVGNVVNENSKARSGRAVPAVHLGTLFKAALKKGKSASMVDVAVINLLEWNGDEVHPIVPTLESVKIAERIDMEYILQEMEVLRDGLQKVKKEITLDKKKQPSEKGETGDSFIENASAFLENGQTLLEEIQAAVHAAKAKTSDVFASLGLPQSGEKAMKTDELFNTTLKLATAADASMAKCRKNGRGKKMEDEEIQKLQRQHQQQRKEQSNIDRDQYQSPETIMSSLRQSDGQGKRERDEEPRSLQQHSRKVESHNAKADDENVSEQRLQAPAAAPIRADPGAAILSAIAARKKPDDDNQDEDVADQGLQAPPAAAAAVPAPANPRAAILSAIAARKKPDDDNQDEDVADQRLQAPPAAAAAVPAPANPRAAMLSAIAARKKPDDDNQDEDVAADTAEATLAPALAPALGPRAAMLSAIAARKKPDNDNQDEDDTADTAEATLAPALAPALGPRAAMLSAIAARKKPDDDNQDEDDTADTAEATPAPALAPALAPAPAPASALDLRTPADPRTAMLSAIRSRLRDEDESNDRVGGVDPRTAMLSAIKAQRRD